jgi:putative glutamine amidotransferase
VNVRAPRIAVPVPQSFDEDYVRRALPQYEEAVRTAGGEPVAIALEGAPADIMKHIARCDGVLLPGSAADVDPAKYDAVREPHTARADAKRDTVDELLLQDAYNMRKPILAICYGLQILNVYRSGTLVQHITDWLPADKRALVNHEAGRKVPRAHWVEIEGDSQLAQIVTSGAQAPSSLGAGSTGLKPGATPATVEIEVNSSHHQSADVAGDGLRTVARCKEDGVIEALEGTAPDHFVLAVQWHPERSVGDDEPSRAIFRALVDAARVKHEQLKDEFEAV